MSDEHDPRLNKAMAEIKTVLLKHDIAASVALASPTHSAFFYHLSPHWSALSMEKDGNLRFRSHHSEYDSKELQKTHVEHTVHLVFQLRDLSLLSARNMQQVCDMIEQHFEVDHHPFYKVSPK